MSFLFSSPDSNGGVSIIEFSDNTVDLLTIPDNDGKGNAVTSIGEAAFYNYTSLVVVTLPYTIKSIRSFAFSGCSSLILLIIPNSVTSIESYAFSDCALQSVNFEHTDALPIIDANAFANSLEASYYKNVKSGVKGKTSKNVLLNSGFSKVVHINQRNHNTKSASDTIYQFKMKDIDGNLVDFSKYKGMVILIVNVASESGFTPQYAGLQKLYDKNKTSNFVVFGFPCNDFGGQEPGTNADIKSFVKKYYNVTFPMFEKVITTKNNACDLYKFLYNKTGSAPNWNFCKYLIDRKGNVVDFFRSGIDPETNQNFLSTIKK